MYEVKELLSETKETHIPQMIKKVPYSKPMISIERFKNLYSLLISSDIFFYRFSHK